MTVRKRKVFYLSGFDPRGPHHYHALTRAEAAKTAMLTGQTITVSPRGADGWTIKAEAQTEYDFLRWDDLVRAAWIRHPARLVARALAMYLGYARQCRWGVIGRLSRGPLVTFFYPLAMLTLLPLLLTVLLHLLLPLWLALPLALGAAAVVMQATKALWLLRFFVFNYSGAKEEDTALMARLEEFAERIVASFSAAEPYDEILLACHSNGSILAVPLMEKIAARTGGVFPKHFRLLTLGQCIPLVSYLRNARAFSAQLDALATRAFYWGDISFMPDGACYANTNPFGARAYAAELVLRSPRFFKYYTPERYAALRRNKYQLHFAYLHCGDTLSPFNYIRIISGSTPLPERMEEGA